MSNRLLGILTGRRPNTTYFVIDYFAIDYSIARIRRAITSILGSRRFLPIVKQRPLVACRCCGRCHGDGATTGTGAAKENVVVMATECVLRVAGHSIGGRESNPQPFH